MRRSYAGLVAILSAGLLAACGGGGGNTAATATEEYASPQQMQTKEVRVRAPAGATGQRVDERLRTASGQVEVWVSLDDDAVAANQAALAEAAGLSTAMRAASVGNMREKVASHRQAVLSRQSSIGRELAGLGGRELGRVQVAHNAIAVRIDASQLQKVAALSGVARVRPVLHYELTLSQTVPYVGGKAVQDSGRDGTGVKVAVLDSGIDYTHRNLSGAGTDAAYAAAYGTSTSDPRNTTLDGLFPTAKVVGGYDFVGETWGIVNGAEVGVRTEDPDPIDLEGHGTHVADIIAGKSLDGAHVGMAPGASLVAVKVCSAISSSCNGVALLKAMDYALDPNGDGDTSDAVDVINMSLGSSYGQIEDDLTLASANAVKLGVVVVVSAGNSANKPYVVGSPSTAVGVISVAQTEVPSATAVPLVVNSPAAIAGIYTNTQTVDWAPVGAGVTGDVAFIGRGCPAGGVAPGSPADPILNSPSGKVALIDRGGCSVSLKVDYAAKAGATGVLIGLVAPGDAVSFSFGGGDTFVPTMVIQQSISSGIKAQLAAGQVVNVSVSTAAAVPLVGSLASTSSRGPAYSTQHIKPEIGAPGASLSAEAGTGQGQTAFGGTSGAAPMVSGAAALLLQAHPGYSPERIKALLMNSAETVVYTNPALLPGELAPITRIGAGELRVDRAVKLTALAWNRESKSAALSFGAVEADKPMVLRRKLRIENHGNTRQVFAVTPSFRYANDEASGAVKILAPGSVSVGAQDHRDIDVLLVIDPTKLASWTLNGGSLGGNGAALNGPEYDGYVTLTSGSQKLSVPWHVLPRKAADTQARSVVRLKNSEGVPLVNTGAEAGDFDVFSQTGSSPKLPRTDLPKPGDNFAVVDLKAVGVRYLPSSVFGADYLEFAINTHGRRAHPNYPAEFDILIDTNGDGVDDYLVYNAENGGFAATGQNLVFVVNLATGAGGAVFYGDADLNSGNMIFTVPMNASAGPVNLGVAAGTTINFSVTVFDNYFSGAPTDEITGMRFTPGKARYETVDLPFGSVPPASVVAVPVRVTTVPKTASTETGLLFMFRRNADDEADTVKLR